MTWMRGHANDAVCPKCETYTEQTVVRRGVRQCIGCRTVFNLKDTTVAGRKRKKERP